MVPSFYVVSSFLCAEDNNSISDDCDLSSDVEQEFGGRTMWDHGYHRNWNQYSAYHGIDGERLIPLHSDEFVGLMVEKEHQHLPKADYLKRLQTGDLDLEGRKEAIDWIGKVHSLFFFGPLCWYLSINYLDRFLSAYELPKGKAWMMQLLAVACLSIAAKIDEAEVPSLLDLQSGESEYVFEARTVQRMELLVLNTLGWRMQAITPLSFIDHFLYKLHDDQIPPRRLILKSIKLISSAIKGIVSMEFKPSEIAAAVAIHVAVGNKAEDTEKAISLLTQHVMKERILKCMELVDELSLDVVSPSSVIHIDL